MIKKLIIGMMVVALGFSGFASVAQAAPAANDDTSVKVVSVKKDNVERLASKAKDGSSVLSYAKKFVGNRYKWGGSSLTKGTDCSGFVMSVYKHFGKKLPHSSASMRKVGKSISKQNMKPGDVVCYSGHVGIYAGNGKLLSALNKKSGITYNSVTYKKILSIRRLV
jgi:cell wall-associated NlpC family hydrolase